MGHWRGPGPRAGPQAPRAAGACHRRSPKPDREWQRGAARVALATRKILGIPRACPCKPHQSLGAHVEHRWSCRDAALRECARTASTIRCIRCSALPGPCSRSSSSTSTGCCCRCFPARRRAGLSGRCTRPPRRRPSSALGSPRPSTPATPASPPRRRRRRIASPGVASR